MKRGSPFTSPCTDCSTGGCPKPSAPHTENDEKMSEYIENQFSENRTVVLKNVAHAEDVAPPGAYNLTLSSESKPRHSFVHH